LYFSFKITFNPVRTYIIIPAHNEEAYIGKTLTSLINQSNLPAQIVVVDDQSSDKTLEIATSFAEKHDFISVISTKSSSEHLPGSKVINAFYKGLENLDENYDLICKFDADLIFPENYLEKIISHFKADPKVGMAGGFCTVRDKGTWKLENLTSRDHIRGALKTYRKECFLEIGKLKPAMGWDTVDELLAQFHGWKITTDESLLVKHLKHTGGNYNKAAKYKQGAAFYRLKYGFAITTIASAKLAYKKGDFSLFKDYMTGFFKAKKEKQPFLVNTEEGRFIRSLRWKKMLKKLI
jgi:glycosyltransferase involved in cell wall biosynthesis